APRGLGFAIPINTAHDMIQSIERTGHFERAARGRPVLGVFPVDITPEMAAESRMDVREGALVARVERDSPADRAGLEAGDIITRINGERVHSGREVRDALRQLKPGDRVEMTVMRDGRGLTVTARLAEARDQE